MRHIFRLNVADEGYVLQAGNPRRGFRPQALGVVSEEVPSGYLNAQRELDSQFDARLHTWSVAIQRMRGEQPVVVYGGKIKAPDSYGRTGLFFLHGIILDDAEALPVCVAAVLRQLSPQATQKLIEEVGSLAVQGSTDAVNGFLRRTAQTVEAAAARLRSSAALPDTTGLADVGIIEHDCAGAAPVAWLTMAALQARAAAPWAVADRAGRDGNTETHVEPARPRKLTTSQLLLQAGGTAGNGAARGGAPGRAERTPLPAPVTPVPPPAAASAARDDASVRNDQTEGAKNWVRTHPWLAAAVVGNLLVLILFLSLLGGMRWSLRDAWQVAEARSREHEETAREAARIRAQLEEAKLKGSEVGTARDAVTQQRDQLIQTTAGLEQQVAETTALLHKEQNQKAQIQKERDELGQKVASRDKHLAEMKASLQAEQSQKAENQKRFDHLEKELKKKLEQETERSGQARKEAVQAKEDARGQSYLAHVRLAQLVLSVPADGRTEQVRKVLAQVEDKDLRGFEWHYLDGLAVGSSDDDWAAPVLCQQHPAPGMAAPAYLAFHPKGDRLAGCSPGGRLRIWDVATGRAEDPIWSKLSCRGLAWPDERLRVQDESGLIHIRDSKTDKPDPSPKGLGDGAVRLVFSADGKRVAGAVKNQVKVWDTVSGKEATNFPAGPVGKILAEGKSAVALDTEGKRLASAAEDGAIKVWDLATNKEQITLPGHPGVGCLAFSPDGQRLASGGKDRLVRIWHLPLRQEVLVVSGSGEVSAVTFSPDGKRLAAAGGDGRVRIWEAVPLTENQLLNRKAFRVVEESFSRWAHRETVQKAIVEKYPKGDALGQAALELVRNYRQDAYELYEASWETVSRGNGSPAAYELARLQAEAALRIAGEKDEYRMVYQTSLGGALYRLGKSEEAIKLLRQVVEDAKQNKVSSRAALPFLVLAHHQRGNTKEADELRKALKAEKPPLSAVEKEALAPPAKQEKPKR